jgi:hypothetical protein
MAVSLGPPTGSLLVRTAYGYNVHQSLSGGSNAQTSMAIQIDAYLLYLLTVFPLQQ